jgi:hypothetical protein
MILLCAGDRESYFALLRTQSGIRDALFQDVADLGSGSLNVGRAEVGHPTS